MTTQRTGYLAPKQKRSHPQKCEALLGAKQSRKPHFLMVIWMLSPV